MNIILILALVAQPTHARGIAGMCARFFSGLIADDPYQFESASTAYVLREYERLGIRARWNTLTKSEKPVFKMLGGELRTRFGMVDVVSMSIEDYAAIFETLERFQGLE